MPSRSRGLLRRQASDTVKRYQDLGVTRVMIGLPTQDPADVRRSIDALYE